MITLLPASFAINPDVQPKDLQKDIATIENVFTQIDQSKLSEEEKKLVLETQAQIRVVYQIAGKPELTTEDKVTFRSNILQIQDSYKSMATVKEVSFVPAAQASDIGTPPSLASISGNIKNLAKATDYVPWFIILMVSLAIGAGTMIGWQRIVRTIGEKIGKYKMNYSQAASSAIITAGTIGLASDFGLPVSTTHVMSSSVAGTMVEEHGWKNGVDPHMVKHILLAWVLTLPTCILLAGTIFLVLNFLFVR